MPSTDGTLSAQDLELLRKDFSANPAYRLAQNAVTRVTVDDVAINREIVNTTDHSLSILLDDWKVTNQKRSGRCWLFAGLNLLRVGAMKKMGLKDFEFSQNYVMFWDKIERANYFLEAVIETADRDIDDRTVAYLLDAVADDGGQWNMFVAIVAQARPGAQGVHARDPELVRHRPDELGAAQPAAAGGQVGARGLRRGRRRGGAGREGGHPAGDLPRALHPPRHPAGAHRLAVDRQGPGVPPRRRAHPAGVRGPVRDAADRRLRVPGARPAPVQPGRPDLHGRSTSATCSALRRSPTSTSTCR